MPKRKPSSVDSEPQVTEGFVERPSATDEGSVNAGQRLTLYLSSDGSVDWSRTRRGIEDQVIQTIKKDSTLLNTLAADPDFADSTPGAAANDPTKWQSDEAGFVLDLLDKIEGLIVSRLSKQVLGEEISMRTATICFSTTDEEHEIQDPRAAQALNDFANIDDPKWRNVTLLGMAHGASFIRKFKAAVKMQSKQPVTIDAEPINKPNGKAKPEPVEEKKETPVETKEWTSE